VNSVSAPLRHSRNIFITGLLTITPLVVTVWVLGFLFRTVDGILAPILDRAFGRHIPGLGFLLTLVLIYLVGLVMTNLVGQKLVAAGERILTRVPIVKGIYGGSKQLVEAVSLPTKGSFTTVVLVEYPRREMYMIGFITRQDSGTLEDTGRIDTLTNVFIPNTPNPASGRFVMVPNRDLIPVSISVEEGLKLIISGGFVSPKTIRAARALRTETAALGGSRHA
jgi:uncharacterized membrane protein